MRKSTTSEVRTLADVRTAVNHVRLFSGHVSHKAQTLQLAEMAEATPVGIDLGTTYSCVPTPPSEYWAEVWRVFEIMH